MRLLKTGKYEAPIELKWNECLFVDRWGDYHLYSECGNTNFDFRLNKYLECRQRSKSVFSANTIKLIDYGRYNKKD
jgi:hypothetical protein